MKDTFGYTKRMTSNEINQLFDLLYRLDDHCDVYMNNDKTASQVIHMLNEKGFRKSN